MSPIPESLETRVFVEGEISYREYGRKVDGKTVQWPIAEIIASFITAIHAREKAQKGAAA